MSELDPDIGRARRLLIKEKSTLAVLLALKTEGSKSKKELSDIFGVNSEIISRMQDSYLVSYSAQEDRVDITPYGKEIIGRLQENAKSLKEEPKENKMPEESELIKAVEAYNCKVCGETLTCSREKALEHAKISVDQPLPKGLLYQRNDIVWVILNEGNVVLCDHGIAQDHLGYLVNSKRIVTFQIVSSREVKEYFAERINRFLTEEEFEEFKQIYKQESNIQRIPAEELVRTTPELEALVAEV